ncbi:ABC transporter ATP-binding protein [Microbacterium lacus]|uniref:ABC transporter ATP-binding protein n=1 Tax=Microbacterium lacus TaxID=415217 RepID=A0ABN2G2I1_9MICO
MHSSRESGLAGKLRLMLRMAGASPWRWVASTLVLSLLLAALDTLGVAAMVPLTQLIGGADPTTGFLGTISSALGTTDPATLIPAVAGIVMGLFVIKSAAALVFRWWLLGRTTRVSALSAAELMRRYVLAPYSDHRGRRMSEVYRNVNDATNQAASVLLGVMTLVTDALVVVAITVILAITAPLVTLLTVALFGFFVFGLQHLLRGRQARIGEEMADASLEAWQYLMPGLEGFREARLTSSARTFVNGFRNARLRYARAGRELGILSEAPRYVLEIVFVIAIVGISIFLFATGSSAQAITVLGVFAAASLRALPTLNRITATLATIRTGRAGLDIVSRISEELEVGGTHDEEPRDDIRYGGDITLRGVTFRYPDAAVPVLDELTLTIAENRTTAFVGSSGAGKSTLLDLILGLLEPTSGAIECGGRSIFDDRAGWYRGLGVVPQDVFLINDTLAANIAFGEDPERIDLGRITEVVAMAQLEALIAELPEGLQTTVGERGVRLSGGQRQRLGLARALYRRPGILVLDEATSALDNATEHEIATTLRSLQGTMTILIVAHRLSTVRSADTLVFLQAGRIASMGTFEDVRGESVEFARLVELGELN